MYYTNVGNGDVKLMGFWSWLGLPEKSDVITLQSEINLLKKDNEEFHKHNLEMKKELEETYGRNCDNVINEILFNRRQLEILFQKTNSCIEQLMNLLTENQKESANVSGQINEKIEECIKLLAENKNLICEHDEKVLNVFKTESDNLCGKVEHTKSEIITKMQGLSEVSTKENTSILKEIVRYSDEIEKLVSECQKSFEKSLDHILADGELLKEKGNQLDKKIDDIINIMVSNHDNGNKQYEKLLQMFKTESDSLCCKLIELKNNALEKLQENSDVNAKENAIVLNEITRCAGEIELMLTECQKCIDISRDGIFNNSQLIKGNESQINNLLSIAKGINENTDNMDEIQESLSSLSESVKYLWTIMKAVWVDSMLSDIESMK